MDTKTENIIDTITNTKRIESYDIKESANTIRYNDLCDLSDDEFYDFCRNEFDYKTHETLIKKLVYSYIRRKNRQGDSMEKLLNTVYDSHPLPMDPRSEYRIVDDNMDFFKKFDDAFMIDNYKIVIGILDESSNIRKSFVPDQLPVYYADALRIQAETSQEEIERNYNDLLEIEQEQQEKEEEEERTKRKKRLELLQKSETDGKKAMREIYSFMESHPGISLETAIEEVNKKHNNTTDTMQDCSWIDEL